MKRGIIISVIISLASMFLFSGCLAVDHNFSKIRNDVLSAAGDNFNRDVEFSLGSAGMGLVRTVVKFDDKDKDAREIIRHIAKVQVGVYKNTSHILPADKILIVKKIDRRMRSRGWNYLIKNFSRHKMEMVYVKMNGNNELSEMFVINLDRKELAIVEIKGDMEKILAYVIKEKGIGTEYAVTGY